MYRKQKKQDPLIALQQDINQLGLLKYIKAKKAKVKAKKIKDMQQQENSLIVGNNVSKLPSIYENGKVPLKFASLHNEYNDFLLSRIKQFENRINDLQTQNTIKKKQNDKLMDHIAKLRVGQKNIYQSRPQREVQPMMPMFSPFQQPYMFPPFMGQQAYNPYQPQQFGPPLQPFQQNNVKNGKPDIKKMKLSLISRFRVAGLVVYFCFFFKKYSKTFTIQRFDLFKQAWLGWESIQDARNNLNQYFKTVITLDIFERQKINDLDSLKNLADQKKKIKKQKQKQKLKKKMKRAKTDSDSESDQESEDESDVSNSQNTDKRSETNSKIEDSSKVFQFYLKIDVAVSFVVEFVKEISKSLQIDEFYQKNPFLLLLLNKSFQPDHLHQQEDLGYLCVHPSKGYSQAERAFVEYLLLKNVYLFAFTEGALLSQFGRMYYVDKKNDKSQSNENRVFFSFFIRTSIFKIMIQQYLYKKLQKIKSSGLPKEEFRPFSKSQSPSTLAKNRMISLENNGIDMKQENIQEISQDEIRKKERELKNVLDESCQVMFNKLQQYKKKIYSEVKIKTLDSGYREQQSQYFRLHTKQEHLNAMKVSKKSSLFEKTSQSVYESEAQSSSLGNISIANRIKKDKNKTKDLKKTTKKQSKKPPTPIKDESESEESD